jgi:ABC-type sugar transport system permease subunit
MSAPESPPAPTPTARQLLLAWLAGAVVLALLVSGAMLRTRNLAARSLNERHARKLAGELGGQVRLLLALRQLEAERGPAPGGVGSRERMAALLGHVAKVRGVTEAVILERVTSAADLPFVHRLSVLAHTDARFPPGPLAAGEGGDPKARWRAKDLHDWYVTSVESVERDSARARTLSACGAAASLEARVEDRCAVQDLRWASSSAQGDRIETGWVIAGPGRTFFAGVRLRPTERPVSPPYAWIVLLALFALALTLPQATARSRRWPWLAVGAGLALMSVGCGALLAGYEAWSMRAGAAPGFLDILRTGVRARAPGGLTAVLWLMGTALALLVPILGWRGTWGRASRAMVEHRLGYAYILPAALGMLVLVLVPFVIGLGLGFFNHCDGRYDFVGLRNFGEILSGGGTPITDAGNFYFTLGVTLLWTTLNVALHLSIGLLLALLLKDPLLKGKGIYRVLLILPWAVPNYITALMWKGMFHQQFGAVNQVLSVFGIENMSWFSTFWTAFTANVVTNTWLGFPFMMVVCLGALQSIPNDLYEAAEVDGASRWYQFSRITLPLLKPALLPSVILGSIWTFNMFNVIYLVSGGEPGGSTDILITEAYRWAFIRHERYGLAAAYATLIFLILLSYTLITNRITKANEGALE